jgi:thiosulfate/3-mercaptopyruvate sulfurtransferase
LDQDFDYPNPKPLVSAGWLAAHLHEPNVRVIDGRSAAEYAAGHIPGAALLPSPAFKAAGSGETCSPEEFAATAGSLGVRSSDTVVCYDANGPTAARVWWAFRVFGHPSVKFLHGGFPAWVGAGHPLKAGMETPPGVAYTVSGGQPGLACSLPQALAALQRPGVVFWDTRSLGEFTGDDPRNNDPAKAGHIPGAVHLQYSELVDRSTGLFKPAAEMRALLAARGITPESEIVAY